MKAEKSLKTIIGSKDQLISENRVLTQENKSLKEIVNVNGDLTEINKILEHLAAFVITGSNQTDESFSNTNSKALEWIWALFGEQLFYKIKELSSKKKWKTSLGRKSAMKGKSLRPNPYQVMLIDVYQSLIGSTT